MRENERYPRVETSHTEKLVNANPNEVKPDAREVIEYLGGILPPLRDMAEAAELKTIVNLVSLTIKATNIEKMKQKKNNN